MNKKDLIAAVADDADITKEAAGAAIDSLLENITKCMKQKDDVRLPGFGTFKAQKRNARTARNPRTGEEIKVPAANVPKFQAAKGLKDALN